MSAERNFYLTPEDLRELVRPSPVSGLEAARLGQYSSKTPENVKLATALQDDASQLLVFKHGTTLNFRSLGAGKYVLDQLVNPDSVVLEPGRLCSADVLIAGRISTISQSDEAITLFKVLVASLNRITVRIKSYRVGNGAMAMLKRGARLCPAETSFPSLDLKL